MSRGLRLADLPVEQQERVRAVARMDAKPSGMNKTEARRADALEILKRAGEIADYRFEDVKLRLADNTFLTPDFLVIRADGGIELEDVKGRKGDRYYATEDARVKIKAAARLFPWFRFFTVWESKDGRWNREEVPTR